MTAKNPEIIIIFQNQTGCIPIPDEKNMSITVSPLWTTEVA